MNNERRSKLEQIRPESLDLYYSSKANEARIQIGDRANGLGITGLGGGGSSAPSGPTGNPVHNVWVTFTDEAGNYKYTQYTFETDTWSETIDLGINESDLEYSDNWITSGYGTVFLFEMDNGDDIFKYVDSNGQLTWSENYGNLYSWDVDEENVVGLVSIFAERSSSEIEIITFYKDFKQSFIFDNVGPNSTSSSINDTVVNNKVLYRFGNSNDDNIALYTLDVVTGDKTPIYVPTPGNSIDLDTYDKRSATSNISEDYDLIVVTEYSSNTGNIAELKMIDFSGNVIHDIADQALALGTNIRTSQLGSKNLWGTFYELSSNINNCFLILKTNDNPNKVIYGGYTYGVVHIDTLPDPFNGAFPYYGWNENSCDALVYFYTPDPGSPVNIDDMYFGPTDTNGIELRVVSESGVANQYTLNSISPIVQNGNILNFFTVTDNDRLNLCTINTGIDDSTFTAVSNNIYEANGNISNDVFQLNTVFEPSGAQSLYMNADCSDDDTSFIYRADSNGDITEIYSVGGSELQLSQYGNTEPIEIIFDYELQKILRINQSDNTTTEILNDVDINNWNSTTNKNSWDTTYEPVFFYRGNSEIAYAVTENSIVTLDANHVSDSGEVYVYSTNTNIVVIHGTEGGTRLFFFFSLSGTLLNTYTLMNVWSTYDNWYGSLSYLTGNEAYVVKDQSVTLKVTGTPYNLRFNDNWY